MSLESVGKLVAQHSSSPVEKQRKIDRAELEQAMVRRMINWLIWGMIVLGIGVALLVVNKAMDLGRWLSFVSSVFMLGGMGIATGGVLSAIKQGASISAKPAAEQIRAAPDEKSFPTEPGMAALPSVTERTTQLIAGDEARAQQRERS
ncbi:MAG TPA: hypothetical protein VLB87_15425 [Pyrinomonadaceae bacterium]|nr:hypothetical protein [Pyrinomonadaceae bacterium]